MTTFSALSPVPTNPALPQAPSASSSATLSSDFETFLEMLTAQARYQDPLDPISSSDYAAQLAQFSMVEQQVFTNDQLGSLTAALSGSTIGTLANWVGMDARAATAAQFDGTPVSVVPSIAPNADRAQLVVFNDFGSEVMRRDIPVSGATYLWDGRDASGNRLGDGIYRFTTESFADDQSIRSAPAEVYARVVEAQVVNGVATLKFESGETVPADQVTALREPR